MSVKGKYDNTDIQFKGFPLSRDEKGFLNEVYNVWCMDLKDIKHSSNPTDFHLWLKNKGKGVDHIIYCGKYKIGVEDKLNEATVYRSYVVRDFIPRFNGDNYDYQIVLTTDKSQYTDRSCKLLREHDIKLMNWVDLTQFYCRLLWRQYKSKTNVGRLTRYLNCYNSNCCKCSKYVSNCCGNTVFDAEQTTLTGFWGDGVVNMVTLNH